LFAGVKTDVALRSGNRSVILNIMGNEKSGTATGKIDLAVIDDAGSGRRGIETPGATAGEIGHRKRRCGHQKAMRSD
jgi:hypothetical protein